MWFRVEFDNDGAVLSCEARDASVQEGRHVVYVEALTKLAALPLAQRYFARTAANRARYMAKRALGRCTQCSSPVEAGKSMCRVHLDKMRKIRERARAGLTRPRNTQRPPAESQASQENRVSRACGELRILEEVMVMWRKDRFGSFGTWLSRRIEDTRARLPHKNVA